MERRDVVADAGDESLRSGVASVSRRGRRKVGDEVSGAVAEGSARDEVDELGRGGAVERLERVAALIHAGHVAVGREGVELPSYTTREMHPGEEVHGETVDEELERIAKAEGRDLSL